MGTTRECVDVESADNETLGPDSASIGYDDRMTVTDGRVEALERNISGYGGITPREIKKSRSHVRSNLLVLSVLV
jgi:hypothetical protein